MKITQMFAVAGLVVACAGSVTAANAQGYQGSTQQRGPDGSGFGHDSDGDHHDSDGRYGDHNQGQRGRGGDHRHCRPEYRHGHRYMNCHR